MKEYFVRLKENDKVEGYVYQISRSSVYTDGSVDQGMKIPTLEMAKAFKTYCQNMYPSRSYDIVSRETVITVEGEE